MNYSKNNNTILAIKTLKTALLITLFLVFLLNFAIAQNNDKNQAYWIHEDRVKPSMVEEYKQITKDLVAACKKYNIQEANWLTFNQDDHTYLHVTPIEKFADLDVNVFSTLGEKMGNDEMRVLFERYNSCFDEHGDYVLYLDKELSYMPDGISLVTEGKSHRTFYYNYVTPSNIKNFVEVRKKMKKLFTKYNSKIHHIVYKSGFGVMGTYYLVVGSDINPAERGKNMHENFKIMWEEYKPLDIEIRKYTLREDEKTGWFIRSMSYIPKK